MEILYTSISYHREGKLSNRSFGGVYGTRSDTFFPLFLFDEIITVIVQRLDMDNWFVFTYNN